MSAVCLVVRGLLAPITLGKIQTKPYSESCLPCSRSSSPQSRTYIRPSWTIFLRSPAPPRAQLRSNAGPPNAASRWGLCPISTQSEQSAAHTPARHHRRLRNSQPRTCQIPLCGPMPRSPGIFSRPCTSYVKISYNEMVYLGSGTSGRTGGIPLTRHLP